MEEEKNDKENEENEEKDNEDVKSEEENENNDEIKSNEENEENDNIEEKKENFQSEKLSLTKLEEKINQAYEEHLQKLNKKIDEDEQSNIDYINDINDIKELTTITKERKMSIISNILNNNTEENNKISSPISIKSNEEISSSLDNLISLIRLLHIKFKNSTDKEIQQERIDLITKSLKLIKKYCICIYNQKEIMEMGLLSFIEKINKKEEYQIYLSALDVVKNCTYCENAVQELTLSSYFDLFIEEILKFYENLETIKDNKDNMICFYYGNIILNNITKYNQGYESLYNKIGFEKILNIAKNTNNINMLNFIIISLNNKLENSKEKDELKISELIKDIIFICKKIFDLDSENKKVENIIQIFNLISKLYTKENESLFTDLNIIKIINTSFDKYKNNSDYIKSVINLLKMLSTINGNYFKEINDNNLINKISEQINIVESNDDLIKIYSDLLCSLLTMEENKKEFFPSDILKNIVDSINKYSEKIDSNDENTEQMENKANIPDENSIKMYNSILNNYLRIINYFSSNEKSPDIINEKYLKIILNTIKKTKLDISNIILSLGCLNFYFIKTQKEEWKNEDIQNVYLILNTMKETYNSNSDILINICILIGSILKGLSLKFLIERFYSLVIDCINCQESNEKLVASNLSIIKEYLTKNKELESEVFENTEKVVMNLLKIYPKNFSIIINSYGILSLFSQMNAFAHILVQADLINLIKSSLSNKEIDINDEQKNELRLIIYKLLSYLSNLNDKDINQKISLELMENFVNDLKIENYSEYLFENTKILVYLFKNKLSIETFIQNSGLEAIISCLDKFSENKNLIYNIFISLRDIMFSSNENKEKIKSLNIKDKIQNILDKSDDKNKRMKMEGKILIYNISYIKKEKSKENTKDKLPFLEYIEKEKIIKNNIYNNITKGIQIRAPNPKGKIKEFNLCFSPDLMKIYLKKPKSGNIPPKPKYTIETPLVKDVIQNYEITNFKKGGLINKIPEKHLCFAIEQELIEGQKSPKTLIIICNNNTETNLIWGSVEIIVDYIKRRFGKEYKLKIDDYKQFFDEIEFEQSNKNYDRKKSVFLINKIK